MIELPKANTPPGYFTKISRWQRFKWWLGIGVYEIVHTEIDWGYKTTPEQIKVTEDAYKLFIEALMKKELPPMKRKD